METSRTLCLNVNPAEVTLGSLHPEAGINRLRRNMDIKGASLARRKSGGTLRAFFGSTSATPLRSRGLLAIRLLAAAGFIALAIVSPAWLASAASIFAASSILGLGNRFFMIISAFILTVLTGCAFEAGQLPIFLMAMAIISITIGAAGPGRYSMDAILRRNIFRSVRRRETRRLMERRFSYRAYHYANF